MERSSRSQGPADERIGKQALGLRKDLGGEWVRGVTSGGSLRSSTWMACKCGRLIGSWRPILHMTIPRLMTVPTLPHGSMQACNTRVVRTRASRLTRLAHPTQGYRHAVIVTSPKWVRPCPSCGGLDSCVAMQCASVVSVARAKRQNSYSAVGAEGLHRIANWCPALSSWFVGPTVAVAQRMARQLL